MWQETVSALLAAGVGVAPLALLTNEADADLPAAFTRFRRTLRDAGVTDNVKRGPIGSSFVLCGLRYDDTRIDALYQELSMTLEDSTTYQLILRRGAIAATQPMLMIQGTKRFGPAPEATEAALRAITDRQRLERMAERVLDAAEWNELLATTDASSHE